MRNRQMANLVLSLQAGPFCTSHSFARNMSDRKRRLSEEVVQCGGVAILLCSSSRGGEWVAFVPRHNSRNDYLCWNRGLVFGNPTQVLEIAREGLRSIVSGMRSMEISPKCGGIVVQPCCGRVPHSLRGRFRRRL